MDDSTRSLVYERIKARVMANEFPAGQRIKIERLTEEFHKSVTPIRESLIRLSEQGLINEVPNSGFFAKEISESEIAGLYEIQKMLLHRTFEFIQQICPATRILKPPNLSEDISKQAEIPSRIFVRTADKLFLHISRQSGLQDFIDLVANINDRVHFVRKRDYELFHDPEDRLLLLCKTYHERDFETLRKEMLDFFEERTKRLPDLVRLL